MRPLPVNQGISFYHSTTRAEIMIAEPLVQRIAAQENLVPKRRNYTVLWRTVSCLNVFIDTSERYHHVQNVGFLSA